MYVVSVKTMNSRKKRFYDNVNSILNQSFKFDKFCINIDDYMSFEDYDFYFKLKELDERIEINICDSKWRSCNKLLPTLKNYPDDVIITIDDDINYPKDSIKSLVEEYKKNTDCIIAQQIDPIVIEGGKFKSFIAGIDIRLGQKTYGKYLTGCCLFPPYVFEGTDLYDYDKMMACTDGINDEIWFWINSTLKGIKCVCPDYIHDFDPYILGDTYSDGYTLGSINNSNEKIEEYNYKVRYFYGDKIDDAIGNYKIEFVITRENIYNFFYNFWIIREFYSENFVLDVSALEASYLKEVYNFLNGSGFNLYELIKK